MPSTPTATVAGNVRAEMARRKITQTGLADLLNTTQAAVSRRLRGEVPFDVDELAAVASILELPVSRLTAGIDAVGVA